MDRNKDKNLTRIELINACVKNHEIAKKLGLPSSLKTMDQLSEFEKFFQAMDMDGDCKITKEEFIWYFGNDLTVKSNYISIEEIKKYMEKLSQKMDKIDMK